MSIRGFDIKSPTRTPPKKIEKTKKVKVKGKKKVKLQDSKSKD